MSQATTTIDEVDVSDLAPSRSTNDWFLTLWPLAVLFHLAGNDQWLLAFDGWVGWLQVPLLIFATLLLLTRSARWGVAVAVTHIVVTAVKLPLVGNHEIFLLLLHFTVLGAVLVRRGRWLDATLAPLRWVLLVGYGAIAFSKLNHAFLDPAVSCAAVFGDEFGRFVGIVVTDSTALATIAIVITLIIEISIPVLLVVPRFRRHGIVLALTFHTILAFEPYGHVFDFTSVLYVLFFCFLTPSAAGAVSEGVEKVRIKLGQRGLLALVFVMVLGNIATYLMIEREVAVPDWVFDWPIFLAYAGLVLQFVPPMIMGRPSEPLGFSMHPVLGLVVALAVLNAVAPYTELRTSGAFNMYSNLAVSDDESNHLIVGGTPFARTQDLYEVVLVAEDSELQFYDDQQLLIPRNNLVAYAVDNPDDESTVRLAAHDTIGVDLAVSSFVEDRNIVERFLHRLFLRRAVQMNAPESCLRTWGPAN